MKTRLYTEDRTTPTYQQNPDSTQRLFWDPALFLDTYMISFKICRGEKFDYKFTTKIVFNTHTYKEYKTL